MGQQKQQEGGGRGKEMVVMLWSGTVKQWLQVVMIGNGRGSKVQ